MIQPCNKQSTATGPNQESNKENAKLHKKGAATQLYIESGWTPQHWSNKPGHVPPKVSAENQESMKLIQPCYVGIYLFAMLVMNEVIKLEDIMTRGMMAR